MRPFLSLIYLAILFTTLQSCSVVRHQKPLQVLLITGGCCHNYPFQTQKLQEGLAKFTEAKWTVINEGGTGTDAMISLYDNKNWAQGYDVVVHNECFADTKSTEYIKKITEAHHAGIPAAVIHCAMHSYRQATIDDWREFLGVSSNHHDHQSNYPVKKTENDHSILKDMPDNWSTPMDELYIIDKIWPNTTVLATSVSERDGKTHPVIWTNTYGNAKVFGTSFGHSDSTFATTAFIKTVSRGILWAAGRLK